MIPAVKEKEALFVEGLEDDVRHYVGIGLGAVLEGFKVQLELAALVETLFELLFYGFIGKSNGVQFLCVDLLLGLRH